MRQRKNKFRKMKYDQCWLYDLYYGTWSRSIITFSNDIRMRRDIDTII